MPVAAVSHSIQKGKEMGEVRVRAKLTNASDEVLHRQGKLRKDQVRTYETDALIDMGAERTVIPSEAAQQLGLGIRGQRVAEYADGRKESVGVTEPLVVEIVGRDTIEEALVLGDEVLSVKPSWKSWTCSPIAQINAWFRIQPI